MRKELPIYEAVVDDNPESESELTFIALVKKPAIEKDFMAFEEYTEMKLAIVSEEKRIISGALMLANTPIYRKPPEVPEEGYVVFSKETVYKMVQKFFKTGCNSNVNLLHLNELQMDDVVLFESFISDIDRGIMPMKGFEDAPDGSWFGSFKVYNDAVWEMIKAGDLRGFSIQGSFGVVKPELSEENTIDKIKEILNTCEEED
jgi:hypothetical protein